MISSLLMALLATAGANDQQVAVNTAKPPMVAVEAGTTVKPEANKSPRKARRYCVDQTHTGSRMSQRKCNTREGWLAEGWDPLEEK